MLPGWAGIQIPTRSRSVKNVAVLGSRRNKLRLTSPSADVFQGSPFEHLPTWAELAAIYIHALLHNINVTNVSITIG